MSDTSRGLVLLASLLLWSPVLPRLLAGELSTVQAGLRYAAALLLAWGGGTMLTAMIRGYSSPTPVEPGSHQAPMPLPHEAAADTGSAGRRQEDTSGG